MFASRVCRTLLSSSDLSVLADRVPNAVYICHSSVSFTTHLAELSGNAVNSCTPVVAFFSVGFGNEESLRQGRRPSDRKSLLDSETRSPSPASSRPECPLSSQMEETYGLQLLSTVAANAQIEDGPNLVIPVAVVRSAGPGPVGFPARACFPLSLDQPEPVAYRSLQTRMKSQSAWMQGLLTSCHPRSTRPEYMAWWFMPIAHARPPKKKRHAFWRKGIYGSNPGWACMTRSRTRI